MTEISILIASAVNKKQAILSHFLKSLDNLENGETNVSYCFVDDNDEAQSTAMLEEFVKSASGASLLEVEGLHKNIGAEKNDHMWNLRKIEKIAHIKNCVIQYFLSGSWSHLFLVDADLVLKPETLQTLLQSEKDIVSNIFWTKWQKDGQLLPQVWLKDFYTLHDAHMLYPKTQAQIAAETNDFLNMLKKPGIYKVGGLGACTLIARKPLMAGLNFSPIYNLSFWGEDRSFCIRAAALGFELFVNTTYPAFHIYRDEDLELLNQI